MSETEPKFEHVRRNSMRLRGFDYASQRSHFVTIVAHERQCFFKDVQIATATIDCLLDLREKYKFNLYQYCLMPDHFHALLGIGESKMTLGAICGAFKSLSTREFWAFGAGQLWQKQFFDHVIRNEQDFLETVEYIQQNPLRKNLVMNGEDWQFAGSPDLQKFYF